MKHVLRGDYWHSYNSTKNMLIMSHDPVCSCRDLAYISTNPAG